MPAPTKSNGHVVQTPPEAVAWEDTSLTRTIAPNGEPESIIVDFMDYEEVEKPGPTGTIIRTRRPVKRLLEVYTFVPTSVMQQLLTEIDQMPTELGSLKADQKVPVSFFKKGGIEWIYRQVLHVVQLYEPDMTLERLMQGIEFQPMIDLFTKCFRGPLAQMTGKKAAPETDAPES